MMPRIQTCPTCGSVRVPPCDEAVSLTAARRELAWDLNGAPEDCWRFFARVFMAPVPTSVRALAPHLGVTSSTLQSRFFRAGLPGPKAYIRWARILQAAWLIETEHMPIGQAALEVEASSPQSFIRMVRLATGQSAGAFFATHASADVFRRIRETLFLPHLPTLRQFNPLLTAPVHVLRHEAAQRKGAAA